MNFKAKLSRVAIAVALSAGLSSAALAQQTSSGIRGTILDPAGAPEAGVDITVTHLPSGTRRTVTTNEDGNYTIQGLRVGGPYKVTIDSKEFEDQTLDGLFLQLGQFEKINRKLNSNDVEVITVSGSSTGSYYENIGASSYFGEEAILGQSGLTRDIKDVIRANPLVSVGTGGSRELSIAGNNPRFNSITVDGISQNDNFGLNGGGFPTQRSPFPLDALDQITVDTVPFTAKQGGFTGGLINAVFKSGTNEVSGNFFYEKIGDELAGDTVDSRGNDTEITFGEVTYGATFGAPIIKDKLFFFGAYQKLDIDTALEWGPAGAGFPNDTDITLDEINEVINIAQNVYSLSSDQVGGFEASPVEEDESIVAKLDWNINDYHRASLTYQYNKGNVTANLTNNNGTLTLSSGFYNRSDELQNYSAKLYSDWSDNFSTEIAFNVQDVDNGQVSFSDIGSVTIEEVGELESDVEFGTDPSRHANKLSSKNTTFRIDANYLWDDHNIEFGIENQSLEVFNIFLQNSKGTVVFEGLENFRNGLAASYDYQNGIANNPANAAAEFTNDTLMLYVQDTWDINDDLTLSLGVRYERFSSDDRPEFNEASFARTGVRNDATFDGRDVVLPRFSFNYAFNDDVTLRGGIGMFAGGQPNVWLGNSFSQAGVNSGQFQAQDVQITGADITGVLPAASAAIPGTVDELLASGAEGVVSLLDPDFDIPTDIRSQIGVDYVFDIPGIGEQFTWSTEYIYTDRDDAPHWIDVSLPGISQSPTSGGSTALTATGQTLYVDDDENRDLMLTNSSGGRSNIITTSLNKSWEQGVSMSLSYAYQDITEANQGTSSTSQSNYRFSPQINRNDALLGTGRFETEHRLVASIGYKTEFFSGYETNFNLFFERRSGRPISYTAAMDRGLLEFGSDEFRNAAFSPEFNSGNYLAYIPDVNDPNVVYASPELEAELQASIAQAGLAGYAGGFVPKGAASEPWITTLDLSVTQEIPGLMEGHKGRLIFIVDNLLNLVDSSAGRVKTSNFGTFRLYDVDTLDSQGRYVIDRVRDDSTAFDSDDSTWRIKIGISYDF
ncbi:TonB-dependent receptor [Alteromonas sp.]|uniref:TonB-dependent receptor n=1 Tax=Alteromonas sp. TaxID=232 RepID=UPI000B669B4D|nr:TonB-dependent receptor [Alteromonas sp.]MAI38057.1 hypothetical protein [Alteromonas sp.]OUX86654.1 MAG: hypothetical protein CBB95_10695 [Alteromonas sp. TMED35]|tara:strand:- start:2487 stop:5678 length:3192 start_codon:yes stop_codon:yes gene_type:complete